MRIEDVIGFAVSDLKGTFPKVSINYDVTDTELMKKVETGKNESFLCTDPELKEHITAIVNYINTKFLNTSNNK